MAALQATGRKVSSGPIPAQQRFLDLEDKDGRNIGLSDSTSSDEETRLAPRSSGGKLADKNDTTTCAVDRRTAGAEDQGAAPAVAEAGVPTGADRNAAELIGVYGMAGSALHEDRNCGREDACDSDVVRVASAQPTGDARCEGGAEGGAVDTRQRTSCVQWKVLASDLPGFLASAVSLTGDLRALAHCQAVDRAWLAAIGGARGEELFRCVMCSVGVPAALRPAVWEALVLCPDRGGDSSRLGGGGTDGTRLGE